MNLLGELDGSRRTACCWCDGGGLKDLSDGGEEGERYPGGEVIAVDVSISI